MSTWQPIETAPKDGRMIWLWWPYWSRTGTRGYWKHGRWVADDSMSDTDDEEPPTHWMPLPIPPPQETPARSAPGKITGMVVLNNCDSRS